MNTIPSEIETMIYQFVDAKTLYLVNREANQIAKERMQNATQVLRRAAERHLLVKRWVDQHEMDVDSYEPLTRFVHKRFYPLAYRLPMMLLAVRKVLRNDRETKELVLELIEDDTRPVVERYNEYIDLLDQHKILANGW